MRSLWSSVGRYRSLPAVLASRVFVLPAAWRDAPRAAGGEAAGDCPFESRPAQRPHLTPPQPRRWPSASLRATDSLAGWLAAADGGRSQARLRTCFISAHHRRSWLFKYDIGAGDLRYSLPHSIKKGPN